MVEVIKRACARHLRWAGCRGACRLTTLKEFEAALREQGMTMALAILEKLKERDRAKRTVRVGRRIAGKKMTPELARRIIELDQTTQMTQQEIAFQLGVNQGRVNEVLKHGKCLQDNPKSEEAVARDRAKARMRKAETRSAPVSSRKIATPPDETSRHLAERLSEAHELPKRQANEMLVQVVEMIARSLKKGEKIRLTGLGILQVRKRVARMGRNPQTGEPVKIKASKKIAFRAAKDLKEAI